MQQHCDPDVIALRAIGESVGSDDQIRHLSTCSRCAEELESLHRVASIAREEDSVMLLENPSPRVWERITAELKFEQEVADLEASVQDSPMSGAPAADVAISRSQQDAEPVASARGEDADPGMAPSAGTAGARRWMLALAAGVTGVAVGGVAVSVWSSGDESEGVVVAQTALDPLPEWPSSTGDAAVLEADDGSLLLEVSVADSDATDDGFREVWLIDTNVEGMVSLGVLDGDDGVFPIPAGVDVGEYPIVDVSLEPTDGVPTHSGNSIVRGVLDA